MPCRVRLVKHCERDRAIPYIRAVDRKYPIALVQDDPMILNNKVAQVWFVTSHEALISFSIYRDDPVNRGIKTGFWAARHDLHFNLFLDEDVDVKTLNE